MVSLYECLFFSSVVGRFLFVACCLFLCRAKATLIRYFWLGGAPCCSEDTLNESKRTVRVLNVDPVHSTPPVRSLLSVICSSPSPRARMSPLELRAAWKATVELMCVSKRHVLIISPSTLHKHRRNDEKESLRFWTTVTSTPAPPANNVIILYVDEMCMYMTKRQRIINISSVSRNLFLLCCAFWNDFSCDTNSCNVKRFPLSLLFFKPWSYGVLLKKPRQIKCCVFALQTTGSCIQIACNQVLKCKRL